MTKAPMAKWLVDKLIADGVMTSDRVTRNARPRRCPDCGLFTMVALDEILANRAIHIEAVPTTSAGELFALLGGRATYGMDGEQPYQRDARHIAGRPADVHPVYCAHECHSPPLPKNTKFIPAKPDNQEGPCPF